MLNFPFSWGGKLAAALAGYGNRQRRWEDSPALLMICDCTWLPQQRCSHVFPGLAELQNHCEGSMVPPVSFFARQDRQFCMLVLSCQLRVRCSLSITALKKLALSMSGAPAWGIPSWCSGETRIFSSQLYSGTDSNREYYIFFHTCIIKIIFPGEEGEDQMQKPDCHPLHPFSKLGVTHDWVKV